MGGSFLPSAAGAQDFGQAVSPILIVDRERLFLESAYGKQIAALIDEERSRQEAETTRIEAELEVEELALTEARASLPAEEFRARADAFDAKVQILRRDRDQAQAQLVRQIDRARMDFLVRVNPILARLMSEAGAVIMMDRRVALISVNYIDITSRAIERIDAMISSSPEAVDNVGPENNESSE